MILIFQILVFGGENIKRKAKAREKSDGNDPPDSLLYSLLLNRVDFLTLIAKRGYTIYLSCMDILELECHQTLETHLIPKMGTVPWKAKTPALSEFPLNNYSLIPHLLVEIRQDGNVFNPQTRQDDKIVNVGFNRQGGSLKTEPGRSRRSCGAKI